MYRILHSSLSLLQWAVGSDGVTFPHDVGIPIGEGKRWLVLQSHYYNPHMDEGVYDSSGLRAYLAKELRPIDAGIMSFAAGVQTGELILGHTIHICDCFKSS